MAIKIRKKNKGGRIRFQYKSLKRILTPQDVKEADEFDLYLNKTIKKIEKLLLERKIISKDKKKDPLLAWYTIGKNINEFLKRCPVAKEEENIFWKFLYGRSILLHKSIPTHRISKNRNDFRTASLLAKHPYETIKKVGPWALWREILGYEIFLKDKRILDFTIKYLIKHRGTRDEARPLLKAVANRFKKIDTSVLTDNELSQKLEPMGFEP